MSANPEITSIPVDFDFRDANGGDYTIYATPEAIEAGYMINTPVIVCTPDGKLHEANLATITPKGMVAFMAEMPDGLKPTTH